MSEANVYFFHSPTIWNRSLLLWFLVKALCHPGRTLSFWFSSWPFSWLTERKGGREVWRGEEGEQRHSLVLLGYRSVDQCSIPALSFILGPMSKYSHHGGRRQVHRHQTQLRSQQLCLDFRLSFLPFSRCPVLKLVWFSFPYIGFF